MWKKIATAGAVGATILAAGTAALATSGSPSPSPSASSSAAADQAAKHGRGQLKRALHAQWVTRDAGTKATVTHDAIRGQVTAVSATSISVKALDDVSQTYVVTSATQVRVKGQAKGASGTISQVHTGDRVLVVGTGTSSFTATHIADAGTK
jgi:hypothetical protein